VRQEVARFWVKHEEHQQQAVPGHSQMWPEVGSVECGGVREAGGWQHSDGLVYRGGAKVELQYLGAVGQTEEAAAELEDGGDEGGGAGEGVLDPFGAGVAGAEGEREEGVLGVEEEEVGGGERGVVVGEVRGRELERAALGAGEGVDDV
jgi:hypothetical protein